MDGYAAAEVKSASGDDVTLQTQDGKVNWEKIIWFLVESNVKFMY
jgi:hypothetical protein